MYNETVDVDSFVVLQRGHFYEKNERKQGFFTG